MSHDLLQRSVREITVSRAKEIRNAKISGAQARTSQFDELIAQRESQIAASKALSGANVHLGCGGGGTGC